MHIAGATRQAHARLLNAQRGVSRAQTALGAGDTHARTPTVNSIDELHTKRAYTNEWLVYAEMRFR